jgi:cyanophycin synthetase
VNTESSEDRASRVRLVDARRLTGPNLLARVPLVIVELAIDDDADREQARATYLSELARMRRALGFSPEVAWQERPHIGGTVIAYRAPIDVMLPCTEMSEWAAMSACELLASRSPLALEPKRTEIEGMLVQATSPRLTALEQEATRRGVPLLWDDELVSLGLGVRSATWPRNALPEVGEVDWSKLGRIPIALVTGTNGKTTSTRLLARIVREAGHHVGSSSSDAITVGTEELDQGDWTGPAAARVVLRRTDIDFAVLETARGGLLRRGLAVDDCDVALITNVSDDHVGSYGIDDLDALSRAKAIILDATLPTGASVLNARDPRLVALADGRTGVVFFADLAAEPRGREIVERHRARGGAVVFTAGDDVVFARGGEETLIAKVSEIPITFRGAARFNVENVLGVVGAALALGLPKDAIARGLLGFGARDNPRRSALVERGGTRIVLDFGHNPEGVRAVMKLVASLRGASKGRLTVIAGLAGDRADREIHDVARAIHETGPDRVFVRELADYLRGRAPGEVPETFRRAFLALGMPSSAFAVARSEVDALRLALEDAQPTDFVVLLAHLDEEDVRAFLT